MDATLTEAMTNFQLLELALRGAVERFERLIQSRVADVINYPVIEEDLNRVSLGRLAERYATYTRDKFFESEMAAISRSRNRLAHVLFVKANVGLFADNEDPAEILGKVLADSHRASSLADHVHERMQHFYYDLFDERWVGLAPDAL